MASHYGVSDRDKPYIRVRYDYSADDQRQRCVVDFYLRQKHQLIYADGVHYIGHDDEGRITTVYSLGNFDEENIITTPEQLRPVTVGSTSQFEVMRNGYWVRCSFNFMSRHQFENRPLPLCIRLTGYTSWYWFIRANLFTCPPFILVVLVALTINRLC